MTFIKNLNVKELKDKYILLFSCSKSIKSIEIDKKCLEVDSRRKIQKYLILDDLYKTLIFQSNFKKIDAAQMINDYCQIDYLFEIYNTEYQEKLIQEYSVNYSILPNHRFHKNPTYETLVSLSKFETNFQLKIEKNDLSLQNRVKIFQLNLKSFHEHKKLIVQLNDENFFVNVCEFLNNLDKKDYHKDIEFIVNQIKF